MMWSVFSNKARNGPDKELQGRFNMAVSGMILSVCSLWKGTINIAERLQNPSFAIPAEKSHSCPSAIPISNVLPGISFIWLCSQSNPLAWQEWLQRYADSSLASSNKVFPKTSLILRWLTAAVLYYARPVAGSNLPGVMPDRRTLLCRLVTLPFWYGDEAV